MSTGHDPNMELRRFASSPGEAESQSLLGPELPPASNLSQYRVQHRFSTETEHRYPSSSHARLSTEMDDGAPLGSIHRQAESLSQVDTEWLGTRERIQGSSEKRPNNHPDDAVIQGLEKDRRFSQFLSDNSPVWKMYLQQAKVHDDEFVKLQNNDLDSLLIFAGLFSAILSAFLIEIRKGLQADPQTTTNNILTAIMNRLDNNATTPSTDPFHPPSSIIWINALWFLSLTLSLVSALGTILAKGWIAQYTSTSRSGVPADDACLRHRRFNGVTQWHLKATMDFLPVLIHVAFFFFFAGLVILLGQDDFAIRDVILAIVAVTTLIYSASSLLPLLYPDCPFQTPASGLIIKLLSIRRFLAHFIPDVAKSPSQDTLRANALAWLLIHSTPKEVIWKTVEAIAALPASAEIQVGLSEGMVAGILAQGLSECIGILRSQKDQDTVEAHHHVETYLHAVFRLVQTGPSGGLIGQAMVPLVKPGGALFQWRDLGSGTAEIALCIKARIILLHLNPEEFKDLFYLDVPIMFRAVSQLQTKQMLGEIIILHDNSRDEFQSNDLRTRIKAMERLSNLTRNKLKHIIITEVGNIRALIQSLHTNTTYDQTSLRVMKTILKCIQNDGLWHSVIDCECIEMMLRIGQKGKMDGEVRQVWREAVSCLVKHDDIRANIINSDILVKVINDLKDSDPDIGRNALEAIAELSKYDDIRSGIMRSDVLATVISMLIARAHVQTAVLEGFAELSQHDDIRAQIITSNSLVKIIGWLKDSDFHIQKAGLKAVTELSKHDDISPYIIRSDVPATIINCLNARFFWIKTAALEAVAEFSKYHGIRVQISSSDALFTVLSCLKHEVYDVQQAALTAVAELSKHDDIRVEIMNSAVLTTIISWLDDKSSYVRKAGLEAVAEFSKHEDMRLTIMSPDTLLRVIKCLKDSYFWVKTAALEAVTELSKHDDIRAQIISSNALAAVINWLKDVDSFVQRAGLEAVTELSNHDDIRTYIINSDVLVRLTSCLKDRSSHVRKAGLNATAELAKHDDMRVQIMKSDILVTVITLLKDVDFSVHMAALEAVAELSKHSDIRAQVIHSDALVKVISWLKNSDSHVQKAGLNAVTELSKHDDISLHIINSDVLVKITSCLKDKSSHVRNTGLKATIELSKHANIRAQIIASDTLDAVIGCLNDKYSWIQKVALEVVAEFSTYNDLRALIINYDTLLKVSDCLKNSGSDARQAALETIGELSKYEDSRQHIMGSDILVIVISCLEDSHYPVQKAALEALTVLSKHAQFHDKLFHLHLMPILPAMLSDPSTPAQVMGASILSNLGSHDDIRVEMVTPQFMPSLLGMLGSGDPNRCIAATEALLALGVFDRTN